MAQNSLQPLSSQDKPVPGSAARTPPDEAPAGAESSPGERETGAEPAAPGAERDKPPLATGQAAPGDPAPDDIEQTVVATPGAIEVQAPEPAPRPETARRRPHAGEIHVNSLSQTLILVGAGEFAMGSPHGEPLRDEGEWLAIRFGPLPLLGTRIPYARIRSVEPDQTALLDGWGIHWLPGRGWTYNIWGYDCVKLRLDRGVIRVGTDDVENLVRFLRERIGQSDE